MARGMDRAQLGVTEAMRAAYGEEVFRMSHNVQLREGDPVRRLDWAEIERQREGMGLSDAQIADRLGLTRKQVMFIRNSEESNRNSSRAGTPRARTPPAARPRRDGGAATWG